MIRSSDEELLLIFMGEASAPWLEVVVVLPLGELRASWLEAAVLPPGDVGAPWLSAAVLPLGELRASWLEAAVLPLGDVGASWLEAALLPRGEVRDPCLQAAVLPLGVARGQVDVEGLAGGGTTVLRLAAALSSESVNSTGLTVTTRTFGGVFFITNGTFTLFLPTTKSHTS